MKKHLLTLFTILMAVLLVSCATVGGTYSKSEDNTFSVYLTEDEYSGIIWDYEIVMYEKSSTPGSDPIKASENDPIVELDSAKYVDKINYSRRYTFKILREGSGFIQFYFHPYGTSRFSCPDKEYYFEVKKDENGSFVYFVNEKKDLSEIARKYSPYHTPDKDEYKRTVDFERSVNDGTYQKETELSKKLSEKRQEFIEKEAQLKDIFNRMQSFEKGSEAYNRVKAEFTELSESMQPIIKEVADLEEQLKEIL